MQSWPCCPGPGAEPGGAAVPRSVELPYFWQATVEMAPPGAASVLFGGDGLGLDEDVFEGESSRLAVLGRNGDYRALRFPDHGGRAGQDVQLSPDGNLLAETVEAGDPPGWRLLVTDLRTGRSRDYVGSATSCCAQVVAWRPDNGAVLVLQAGDGYLTAGPPAQYVLVDLAGGAVTPIDDRLRRDWSTTAWAAAFAPDGHCGCRLIIRPGQAARWYS
ncbi:hypothetical protein AB0H83_29445 [Dactylosporangium sp. NPDC050688]|uniref:hypothetical protein n=1 Tax=Dactylosporangium sp. NPDC050688 TaxID=3157217 RepID=UPI00340E744E